MAAASDLIFGAVIGLALAVWPGDGLSRTVGGAVRHGVAGGLAAGAGGVAADLCAAIVIGALLLGTGLSDWLQTPAAKIAALISGVTLVALGWRLMEDRTPGAVHRDRGGDHRRSFADRLFSDPFLASLFSLRWHGLWWLGGIGLLLGPALDGPEGVWAFVGGMALTGFGARAFVAVRLAAPGREWALRDRTFRIVTSMSGLGVVVLGLLIGYEAIRAISPEELLERMMEGVFG